MVASSDNDKVESFVGSVCSNILSEHPDLESGLAPA